MKNRHKMMLANNYWNPITGTSFNAGLGYHPRNINTGLGYHPHRINGGYITDVGEWMKAIKEGRDEGQFEKFSEVDEAIAENEKIAKKIAKHINEEKYDKYDERLAEKQQNLQNILKDAPIYEHNIIEPEEDEDELLKLEKEFEVIRNKPIVERILKPLDTEKDIEDYNLILEQDGKQPMSNVVDLDLDPNKNNIPEYSIDSLFNEQSADPKWKQFEIFSLNPEYTETMQSVIPDAMHMVDMRDEFYNMIDKTKLKKFDDDFLPFDNITPSSFIDAKYYMGEISVEQMCIIYKKKYISKYKKMNEELEDAELENNIDEIERISNILKSNASYDQWFHRNVPYDGITVTKNKIYRSEYGNIVQVTKDKTITKIPVVLNDKKTSVNIERNETYFNYAYPDGDYILNVSKNPYLYTAGSESWMNLPTKYVNGRVEYIVPPIYAIKIKKPKSNNGKGFKKIYKHKKIFK